MTLEEFFKKHNRVALAFSGGVDSSYLLYTALRAGAGVQPYFVRTAFTPEFEYRDAVRVCETLGVQIDEIRFDILSLSEVQRNHADRCYHCKKALFSAILARARTDGFPVLMDGTNASDAAGDRPGMRALAELGVRSPLRECGLTKAQVRELSRAAGLFTHDKPAYACLATRIETGQAITSERLKAVERAETALTELGFSDFRVRTSGRRAVLQVRRSQLGRACQLQTPITAALTQDFDEIVLDLKTMRGE